MIQTLFTSWYILFLFLLQVNDLTNAPNLVERVLLSSQIFKITRKSVIFLLLVIFWTNKYYWYKLHTCNQFIFLGENRKKCTETKQRTPLRPKLTISIENLTKPKVTANFQVPSSSSIFWLKIAFLNFIFGQIMHLSFLIATNF